MSASHKRWHTYDPINAEVSIALKEFPALLRQLLFNRQISDPVSAHIYLNAEKPSQTDPFGILGLGEAVDRLIYAIEIGDPIAIYGDYDADGVTATSLLVQVLQTLGAEVQGYIPNRFDEGYGLNIDALHSLKTEGIRLVITVDCGIRSLEEADFARKIGLDLIITDHHHPAQELPQAISVINPKQLADTYAHKELAGVGLAYKLAEGLLKRRKSGNSGNSIMHPGELVDLVAIGTIADLAPLIGENRSLVRAGLLSMRQPRRQGLLSLIHCSGLHPHRLSASDVGFVLAPRLNAAGRLDSALAAFQLLTTSDVHQAGHLAQVLETQNRKRQDITREVQLMAEQLALAEDPNALLLFAVHPHFNPGVVGLAASRLAEQYYRPAIVAQSGEIQTRGSCRSIPEFHITEALDQCVDLLEHHGGHAAAAGFTVRNENLLELKERLQNIVASQLGALDLQPVLKADLELPLSELKSDDLVEMLKFIEDLQPTGYGNPQASFITRGMKVIHYRTVGKEGAHLKMRVNAGKVTYDAIAFRQGHWAERLPGEVDLLFNLETNEYLGEKTIQLNVRDLKPTWQKD
jgi:single-stranded-DNA-specific exonuclease